MHYFRISRLIPSLFLPKTNAQYTKQEQRFFYVAFAKQKTLDYFRRENYDTGMLLLQWWFALCNIFARDF